MTKSLEKKNCPLFLITFFNEVVLISIITKLQSEIYFKITIAILNLYLFGLSDICTINEKHWDILISSANYVIHFEKKNIQEYYEFIKCLHKIYQKLKKQLYNDREILNFLDNMKMNYIFLNDPSEKSIDFFLSHSWKIKLTEDLIKQIPNSYIDIETPNNIVKYKGLKNMGNSNIFYKLLLFLHFKYKIIYCV